MEPGLGCVAMARIEIGRERDGRRLAEVPEALIPRASGGAKRARRVDARDQRPARRGGLAATQMLTAINGTWYRALRSVLGGLLGSRLSLSDRARRWIVGLLVVVIGGELIQLLLRYILNFIG